ncbi:MAG: Slp family lipoprotein [Nitrospirales bacterium]|nr:Slp family lipoprotein [Nitrospirales bacterium]
MRALPQLHCFSRLRGAAVGLLCALLVLPVLPGCITSELVTKEMESQVARDIPFEALKAEPDKFKGRVMVLGGKVLAAKRLKEGTQIEVLQLPLDGADAPIMHLPQSKGRFLAYQEAFLDPATIPEGTAVSMIVEVTGHKTQPIDEVDYIYPTLKIRTLKIWPEQRYMPWPGPYYPYWYSSPRRLPFHPFYPQWWDPWY